MAQTAREKPRMLDTGVPGLDQVLGGGLQEHNSYMIVGASGTGKSVLSQQIAFHRARQGDRALLITSVDEPHRNLLEHLATFRFADLSLIGPQIETISMVPFLDRAVPEKIDVLRKIVLNARPQLVTLDGWRSFRAFLDGPANAYQFLYGLTSWFAVEGITLLLTQNATHPDLLDGVESSLVDGVLAMQCDLVGRRSLYHLRVRKMRGQETLGGLHAYTIDENGITVWPRLPIAVRREDRPWGGARIAFGIPTLDRMLEGGVREGTITLVVGGPGTGKTTLALAYLNQAAREGQRNLWVGFQETRSNLLAMSERWGTDLRDAEARGLAQFITMAPMDLSLERLAALVEGKVGELGITRLVLDGIEFLHTGLPSPGDATMFISWLIHFLRQRGITALITQQAPGIIEQAFNEDSTPVHLAENVIVLRRIEQSGELHRALAILKLSGSAHDSTIREFKLDQYGLTLGDPLSTGMGQSAQTSF